MASVSGTVATRLKLADPERAGPVIEDAVIRSHRIMTAATTVLAYEVLRCLENGEEIPAFWSHSVVEQAIGSVVANYKPKKRELAARRLAERRRAWCEAGALDVLVGARRVQQLFHRTLRQ